MAARALLAGMAMALLGACSSPTDSDGEQLRLGNLHTVDPELGLGHILAPDSVLAGDTFSIEVRTTGDGCHRKGVTELRYEDWGLTVIPKDWVPTGTPVCSRVRRIFAHRVEASLQDVGEQTIVALGWDPIMRDTVHLGHTIHVGSE